MSTIRPQFAIVSDSRHHGFAGNYLSIVRQTGFSDCAVRAVKFDGEEPQMAIQAMEKANAVLAQVGTPGTPKYVEQVQNFLEAYAAVKVKPALGIISHDSDQTRYVVECWLNAPGSVASTLPAGAVSIIDTRQPLIPRYMEKALEILLKKERALHAIRTVAVPLTHVDVESFDKCCRPVATV